MAKGNARRLPEYEKPAVHKVAHTILLEPLGSLPATHDTSLEPEDVRGVYALEHAASILFTQEVELHIAELPRRKPRVNFDRLAFEIDE